MDSGVLVAIVTGAFGTVTALGVVALPILLKPRTPAAVEFPPEDVSIDNTQDVPVLLRTVALLDSELEETRADRDRFKLRALECEQGRQT